MTKDLFQSLLYCGFYAVCSICFSLSAKNLFRSHNFSNIGILLLFESFVNVVICSIINVISICIKSNKNVVRHQLEKEKQQSITNKHSTHKEQLHKYMMTLVFSCLYLANVLFGLKAFQFIPIPLFLTIRRTLIFFIYLINITFVVSSSKPITQKQKVSILLITFGAIVAGCDSLNTNLLGFVYCFLNNIFSACLLQLATYLKNKNKMTPFQLVYNNSLNTLPLLIIYCLITNDGSEFLQLLPTFGDTFYYHISLVAIFGFLLNYSTNLCTMKNSPFSIAITHNLKDIFSSTFSIFMFDDTIITVQLVSGYVFSLIGSIIYTQSKIDSNQNNKISEYQKSYIHTLNTLVNETKYTNSQQIYLQKSTNFNSTINDDVESNLKHQSSESKENNINIPQKLYKNLSKSLKVNSKQD